MIAWAVGERGTLSSITLRSSRDSASAALIDLMNSHGVGWTWEITVDLDNQIEIDGTGPLAEIVLLAAIRREVLP